MDQIQDPEIRDLALLASILANLLLALVSIILPAIGAFCARKRARNRRIHIGLSDLIDRYTTALLSCAEAHLYCGVQLYLQKAVTGDEPSLGKVVSTKRELLKVAMALTNYLRMYGLPQAELNKAAFEFCEKIAEQGSKIRLLDIQEQRTVTQRIGLNAQDIEEEEIFTILREIQSSADTKYSV